MVQWAAIAAACVSVVLLGAVQLASSAAYGDLAVRPSLPAILHDAAPRLLRPLLGDARAQAAAAIHNGDLATAERIVATLPDDAESADLRGRIAQGRGDRSAAVAAYVRAGDVVRAQNLIDALAAADPAAALADQQRLVAALRDDPNAAEVAGEAWWRLGQLQAAAGYRDASRRAAYWRAAKSSYERALQLAPNEETYLLAAAYQSLANGDTAASQRFYSRAAEVVPDSADAYAGLAWTAALSHDCDHARANLSRARALRARTPAARDPVDDPIAGAALKRCAP
ncbi:MAG TPA: hypothetical protein VE826_04830 [Dongiaceae bacterium]|nr:hypothetical protein [Dongiaceae bacterium]